MKKFSVLFILLACTICAFAQDLATVKKLYDSKNYTEAKKSIDALVKGNEGKADYLYWKHKVYQAIGKSLATGKEKTGYLTEGFETLKKYYSIDKNMETMIKDGILANFTAPFEDYYNTFRIDGGALLDKERYTESYEALKWALKVSSFFYEQKWYSSPLDTSITFYAGYAAMKANNANDAVTWFKKLADANASGTDIQIAYGWLANYYYETAKDNAAAKEVVDKGLRYYPKDQYLLDLKIRLERENNNWASIFSTHEKTTADPKAGFTENLSYGADLYDYIFGDGMDANDRIDKELKLVQVLGKAITFKPQSADANYLMGMYYSQKVLEGIDAAKQETDAAKKQNINKTIKENSGNATKYLEAAVTNFEAKGISSLKESSKDNYKQCLSNLIYFYSKSNNMAKMKEAEEKKKGL